MTGNGSAFETCEACACKFPEEMISFSISRLIFKIENFLITLTSDFFFFDTYRTDEELDVIRVRARVRVRFYRKYSEASRESRKPEMTIVNHVTLGSRRFLFIKTPEWATIIPVSWMEIPVLRR